MKIEKSVAGFYPENSLGREVINFNCGWQYYSFDVVGAEMMSDWTEESVIVHLPHSIDEPEVNLSGMRNKQGKVWYRKEFNIDQLLNDHLTFYFEGVMGKCEVYLDGILVGEHFGGYTPFHIEIKPKQLKAGKHILTLGVDNRDDKSFPPGKPQNSLDFAYLGGIYRNVYLIRRNLIHIPLPTEKTTTGGARVATKKLEENTGIIDFQVEVKNEYLEPKRIEAQIEVIDNEKRLVNKFSLSGQINAKASTVLTHEFTITEPQVWTVDNPSLYELIITINDEEKQLQDSMRLKFGVRTFKLDNEQGLIMNNKLLTSKLNGVNRHQDYALVGNALSDSGQIRDALLLKNAGVQIIRAAHYPMAPSFMDACDQLGILVSVANPGWQYYNFFNKKFSERVLRDTQIMLRCNKNRPSVLFWEICLNETLMQPVSLVKKQHQLVHNELPFTSTITAGDMVVGRKAKLDLLFTGTKKTKEKCTFYREYGDGPEVDGWHSQNAQNRVRRSWGEKALLQQMFTHTKYLKTLIESDSGQIGATLWCGIDHQRGYHPEPFYGGLLDQERLAKYSYYLYKCQQLNQPQVHILHELTQISDQDVVVLCNCDEVRLRYLDYDKTLAVKKYQTKSGIVVEPTVFPNVFDFSDIATNYRSKTNKIKMVATGISAGKKVCTTEKRYPERLSGLTAYVDDLSVPLIADGSDIMPVRIELVDQKGIKKVLAEEKIHITVEGEGTLVSEDKGYVTPAFGTASAYIRSTLTPGKIKVTAFAKGLKPVKIELSSIARKKSPLVEEYHLIEANKSITPVVNMPVANDFNDNELLLENKELRLKLTEKEQEIMELMSRIDIGGENE